MSKFSIAKHPMHPALVALPIGLMSWTFFCDAVYVLSGKTAMWYDFSVWSGAAAVVTGLIAALPGFGDYLTMPMPSHTRTIATVHMLLNLTIVALFAVALGLSINHNAVDGTSLVVVFVLHLLGVGSLGLSGFLGGELVFKHHLAVVEGGLEMAPERPLSARRPGAQPR